jgi:hypothetical protein
MLSRAVLLASIGVLAACKAPAVAGIDDAEGLTLFALDGAPAADGGPNRLEGYGIVRQVEVPEAARRAEILEAVQDAIRAGGDQAKCFNPRHAMRVTRGGKHVDLIICFECDNVRISTEEQMRGISDDAMPVLDRALAGGAPRAPLPH